MMNNRQKVEQRLEQVNHKIWYLEMADFLRGAERQEWYKLKAEKRHLMAVLQAMDEAEVIA